MSNTDDSGVVEQTSSQASNQENERKGNDATVDNELSQEALKQLPAQPLKFTGSTNDYFQIWFSNLLLSILTLGIYSAWAKVRQLKYFYGHTQVLESAIGYHATGRQIFIGRVYLFLGLIVWTVINGLGQSVLVYNLPLGLSIVIGLYLAIIFLIPWLVVRSLRFQARMTSWKTIRLNWHGSYGKIALVVLLGPIAKVLSLTALSPVVDRLSSNYVFGHYSIGQFRTSSDISLRAIYTGWLVTTVVFVASLGVALALVWQSLATQFSGTQPFLQFDLGVIIMIYAPLIIYYVIYSSFLTRARLNGVYLSGHAALSSTISVKKMIWIKLSNIAAIIVSIGFLTPWAQIRYSRYVVGSTSIHAVNGGETLVDTLEASGGALGEEFAESEGIDLGTF